MSRIFRILLFINCIWLLALTVFVFFHTHKRLDAVDTRSLNVIDDQGRTRIALYSIENHAAIEFYDEDSRRRVLLFTDGGRGAAGLRIRPDKTHPNTFNASGIECTTYGGNAELWLWDPLDRLTILKAARTKEKAFIIE